MLNFTPQHLDKKGLAAALALTAAALFLPENANAQTVQCAVANAPAEHAICNNEQLIVLDEQVARMSAVRKVSFSTLPQAHNFSKKVQLWMRKRNSCELDFKCIETHYHALISDLNAKQSF